MSRKIARLEWTGHEQVDEVLMSSYKLSIALRFLNIDWWCLKLNSLRHSINRLEKWRDECLKLDRWECSMLCFVLKRYWDIEKNFQRTSQIGAKWKKERLTDEINFLCHLKWTRNERKTKNSLKESRYTTMWCTVNETERNCNFFCTTRKARKEKKNKKHRLINSGKKSAKQNREKCNGTE